MQERHFLNSWKEVADYVGRSERTLQRWEKNWKLPVHRPAGRMRSAVIALTTEIDDWIRQAPMAGMEKVAAILQPEKQEEQENLPLTTNRRLPMLLCVDDDLDSGN